MIINGAGINSFPACESFSGCYIDLKFGGVISH